MLAYAGTQRQERNTLMLDVWMLALGIGLFVGFLGYTALCDAM